MLTIKQKFSIKLPKLPRFSKKMQFSPDIEESDELIESINSDAEVQENDWQLDELPCSEKIAQFWAMVEEDTEKDMALARAEG